MVATALPLFGSSLSDLMRPFGSAWRRLGDAQKAYAVVDRYRPLFASVGAITQEWEARSAYLQEVRPSIWDGKFIGPIQPPELFDEAVTNIEDKLPQLRRFYSQLEELVRKYAPPEYENVRNFHFEIIRIVEALVVDTTDFSLFLRAKRADLSPESRDGPTFDDPTELSNFLQSLISAAA